VSRAGGIPAAHGEEDVKVMKYLTLAGMAAGTAR
jgi:hypothetical protein